MSFFEEQVYSLTEGQDERFKGKINYAETIKKIYEDENLWDNLHSSILDNLVFKEPLKEFLEIKENNLATEINIIDEDLFILYKLEAVLEDGTGIYLSDADQENILYTKEDIIFDVDKKDMMNEGIYFNPEWDSTVFIKCAYEYLEDKLIYLSDDMCNNLDNYVREVGEDEIRESYEALNKNDEMEL